MIVVIGFIFLLILFSAFFSGSETALTAASRPAMHQLEQDGNTRAAIVNRLQEKREQLIGALLLGNNLVNILASSLATSVLIALFGEAGVVYATLAMTLLVLIFAEILPKTYALRNANALALSLAPVVSVIVSVVSPLTVGITVLVDKVISRGNVADDVDSDAELRGAIELRERENDGDYNERAMLLSVLDMADVQVGDIMTHRKNVTAFDINTPPSSLVRDMLESPYTRIPLWAEEPENVVGVLHAKVLLRALINPDGTPRPPERLDMRALVQDPWFVPDTTTLENQLEAFRARREHFALVIDEYGAVMGIVTLEDLLEEIIGDISDEHDEENTESALGADGSLEVEGTMSIREINRRYGWDLSDEEANTIAGLVLHEARHIPEVGQTFVFQGFRFHILERNNHQITRLRLAPPAE